MTRTICISLTAALMAGAFALPLSAQTASGTGTGTSTQVTNGAAVNAPSDVSAASDSSMNAGKPMQTSDAAAMQNNPAPGTGTGTSTQITNGAAVNAPSDVAAMNAGKPAMSSAQPDTSSNQVAMNSSTSANLDSVNAPGKKYSRKSLKSDNRNEAKITQELNQQEASNTTGQTSVQ